MRAKLTRPQGGVQRVQLPRAKGPTVDAATFNALVTELERRQASPPVDTGTFAALLDDLEKFALFHDQVPDQGMQVAFGVAVLAWPAAGSKSNVLTVKHALTKAPKIVLVTIEAAIGEGAGISGNVVNIVAAGFDVYADYVNGFAPGIQNRNAHWLAIGW